jgi:hypothetical protein
MVSRLRPERTQRIWVCWDKMVCKPSPSGALVTGWKCQKLVTIRAMLCVAEKDGPAPTSHRRQPLPSHLTRSKLFLARDLLLLPMPSFHSTQIQASPPTYLAISHSCSMRIPLFWETTLLLHPFPGHYGPYHRLPPTRVQRNVDLVEYFQSNQICLNFPHSL